MKTTRNNLKDIMLLAWSFVRRNGFTMAEAMKTAWRNYKLKNAMHGGIVKFYWQTCQRHSTNVLRHRKRRMEML